MEQLDTWVNAIGGKRVLYAIVFGVLLLVVLRRLFSRPKAPSYLEERQCSCGWRGRVSKFKPVCPRCGKSLAA